MNMFGDLLSHKRGNYIGDLNADSALSLVYSVKRLLATFKKVSKANFWIGFHLEAVQSLKSCVMN